MGGPGAAARLRATTTEVDGVPVVWVDDGRSLLRARLMLRVGTSDEPLPMRGVTHVLEHLALFGLGRPGEHSNGSVDSTTTCFDVAGTQEEVVEFFARLTAQLTAPPTERLESELGVVRAEAASRTTSAADHLRAWRYGALGLGAAAQRELGLHRLDADAVRAWSARVATRQNAVLVLSGAPPSGLRLTLPDGEWCAPPSARDDLGLPGRGYVVGTPDVVAVHAVVGRGAPVPAYVQLLGQRLVDDLRTREAVSYSPQADRVRVDATTSEVIAGGDIVQGRQADAVRCFVDVLGSLAGAGPGRPATDGELKERADRNRRSLADADPVGLAAAVAQDLLLHHPPGDLETWIAEADAVRADDVIAVAEEVLRTAVLQVPGGLRMPSGWTRWPDCLASPVIGRVFKHAEAPEEEARLVLGDEGLGLQRPGSAPTTVHYADTVAVLAWDDGARTLVSREGVWLSVEPTMWERGREAVTALDRALSPDLRVPMGARPPEEVPAPRSRRVRRAQARAAAHAAQGPLLPRLLARWPEVVSVPVVAVPVWAIVLQREGYPNVLAMVGATLMGPAVVSFGRRLFGKPVRSG